MDADRLEELGTAMFGMWWQSSIAASLGKSTRVVRFWASGLRPIPDSAADRIEALARERLRSFRRVVAEE